MNQFNDYLNKAMGTNYIQLTTEQRANIQQTLELNDADFVEHLTPVIEYLDPNKRATINYSNLQKGMNLISQIGTTFRNREIIKFSAIGTSFLQLGSAAMAMSGGTVAMAAMGGPVGVGIAVVSALVSLYSSIQADDANENTPSFQEVLDYYFSDMKRIMLENQNEILLYLQNQEQMEFHTQGMIIDLREIVTDFFQHLHHALTIPTLKNFANIDKKIDTYFSVQDAKIDQISLQPLVDIIFKARPYLKNEELRKYMTQGRFIEYISVLSGFLSETVKGETYTHSVYIDPNLPSENAKRTTDVLSKINLAPDLIPNYIGLIVNSINTVPNIPSISQNAVFNVFAWFKALEPFLALQKQFPQLAYDAIKETLNQCINDVQQFEQVMTKLRSKKIINGLWDALIANQRHVQDIDRQIYNSVNQRFQAGHLIKDIDLLTFSIDELSGHPQYNKTRVPQQLINHDTHIKWNVNGHVGEKAIPFRQALGYPYSDTVIHYLQREFKLYIPQPFIAAELLGLGNFHAQVYSSIYIWQPNPALFNVYDKKRPGWHGLEVTFSFNNQRLEIFSPVNTNYLTNDDGSGGLPLFGGLYYHLNDMRLTAPDYPNGREWDSFHGQALGWGHEFSGPPQNKLTRASDMQNGHTIIIGKKIMEAVHRYKREYADNVLSRLKQSPETERIDQIKQLLISITTLLGYPSELIKDMYETLHPNVGLHNFENYINTQKDTNLRLNLVDEKQIQTLRERMLTAAPNAVGVIDRYLYLGKSKIQLFQMEVEQQKITIELNENRIIEQQTELDSWQKQVDELQGFMDFVTQISRDSPMASLEHDKVIYSRSLSTAQSKEELVKLLQKLCTFPTVSINEVKELLLQLEDNKLLDEALNKVTWSFKPLHLALRAGRPDVVLLLLEYGAVVEANSIEHISSIHAIGIQNRLRALLGFYQTIQKDKNISDKPHEVGRTFGLVRQGLQHMAELKPQQTADIIIGESGGGKSTITNWLKKVRYQLVTIDDEKFLKIIPGSPSEVTVASDTASSETTFPQVVPFGESNLIDMPGYRDNRGIGFIISNGLMASRIPHTYKSIRAIIVVIDAANLTKKRFLELQHSFDMLGKIIDQQDELMPNIQIIVNQASSKQVSSGPDSIINKLKKLQENTYLSANTLFVLKHIKPEQITIFEFPDSALREPFIERLDTIQPVSSEAFNFASQRESEQFRQLLQNLISYRTQQETQKSSLIAVRARLLSNATSNVLERLRHESFTIPAIATTYLSAEQIVEFQRINQTLTLQFEEKEKLASSLEQGNNKLSQYYENYKESESYVLHRDFQTEVGQLVQDTQIVGHFLSKFESILEIETPKAKTPIQKFSTLKSQDDSPSSSTNYKLPPELITETVDGIEVDFSERDESCENTEGSGSLLGQVGQKTMSFFSELKIPVLTSSANSLRPMLPSFSFFSSRGTLHPRVQRHSTQPYQESNALMLPLLNVDESIHLHNIVTELTAAEYAIPREHASSLVQKSGFTLKHDVANGTTSCELIEPSLFEEAQEIHQRELRDTANIIALTNPNLSTVVDGAISLSTFFIALAYKTFWGKEDALSNPEQVIDGIPRYLLKEGELNAKKMILEAVLENYLNAFKEKNMQPKIESIREPQFYKTLNFLILEFKDSVDELRFGRTTNYDVLEINHLADTIDNLFELHNGYFIQLNQDDINLNSAEITAQLNKFKNLHEDLLQKDPITIAAEPYFYEDLSDLMNDLASSLIELRINKKTQGHLNDVKSLLAKIEKLFNLYEDAASIHTLRH
jgi:hypothetical protein